MNEPDRSKVSRLFLEASRLEPDEREDYLDGACGRDGSLRQKVDSLLAGDAQSMEALDGGALASHLRPGPEPVPESIGPFRVLERLGSGGMGTVYRAEQREGIHREVAVKVIRLETDAPQVLARFEAECQALARMSHPNVARIFEVGATERGRPYFAMEYIDGESITRYCDERRLGVRERLELFARVCDGVQHAHQKAVIHRDIKPSNVLVTEVDGEPTPKLIDFGVAKAADDSRLSERTLHTVLGQVMGTLEYMSPEQAEGPSERVDTRSDVYSLGVLLYELLVGELPYDLGSDGSLGLSEMLRRIREDRPERPSRRLTALDGDQAPRRGTDPRGLKRRLRGDLDLITMKALEKDPARRYASPADLAADVRRHLRSEPVLVVPPGAIYRASRFARKHPIGVGLGAAAIALLVGFSWAMWHQRNIAEAKTEDAEAVMDAMVNIVNVAEPYAKSPFNYMALGALEGELVDRPDLRVILDARLKSADELVDLIPALRSGLGSDHPETLRAMHRAATTANRLDGPTRIAMMEEVLAERLASLGPGDPETLHARTGLGKWLTEARRFEEAEQEVRTAIAGLQTTVDGAHPYLLRAEAQLAATLGLQGRFEENLPLLTDVIPRLRREMRFEAVTQHAVYNLACSLAQLGDADGALAALGESIDWGLDLERRVLDDPDLEPLKGDARFEAMVGDSGYYWSLTEADKEAMHGRYSSAIEHLQEAVRRGFDNVEVLKTDPRFWFLSGEPAFLELIERLDS